jgi:hypothetical protein
MKKILMMLVFGMIIVSGCGQDNTESTYDKNQDTAGQDLTTNDNGVRGGDGPNFTKDQDNDMTMGDQNPNLPNTDNQNRHSFSQDVQKAKEVISAQGFEPGSIWINGGTMNVTAHPGNRLSKKDRVSAENSLQKNLTKALPRYEINVDIE